MSDPVRKTDEVGPQLANEIQIEAEFGQMLREYPKVAAVMKVAGVVSLEIGSQCFLTGYLRGQIDAMRYHNETMIATRTRQKLHEACNPKTGRLKGKP